MARYLTTADLAELYRTSPETVRYWRHIGYGPRGIKVGRRWLYAESDVEEWAATVNQTSDRPGASRPFLGFGRSNKR